MARYIDADAAIEYLEKHKEIAKKNCFILSANEDSIIKFLQEKCPTADVVEVVRCKDCKKRYVPYYCALWHSTVNGRELFLERGDYFFCSHGERKEQE